MFKLYTSKKYTFLMLEKNSKKKEKQSKRITSKMSKA